MKKVHLVKESTLKDFVADHAVLRSAARHWLNTLRKARWHEPRDIKKSFGTADLLGNGSNRVVFDIAGNRCRMICKYDFRNKWVHLHICWLGVHREYDEICRKGLQYKIFEY